MDRVARRQERHKKAKLRVNTEEKAIYLCFASPNGQQALKVLRKLFYDNNQYIKGDPYHTHVKLGQRDVIGYIIETVEKFHKQEG